jgi:hypothetical protein
MVFLSIFEIQTERDLQKIKQIEESRLIPIFSLDNSNCSELTRDIRGLTSTSGFVIFMTIWTLKHSIDRYLLSRNIICKEVTTPTTNVFKPSARLSSYKRSGYVAALVIISYSVDRSCSFSRFSNDSTFNYYHLLYSILILCTFPYVRLSNLKYQFIIEGNSEKFHIISTPYMPVYDCQSKIITILFHIAICIIISRFFVLILNAYIFL